MIEHQVSSGPCYAMMTADTFIIGNDRIEQRWRVSHGLLLPAGMREHASVDDWGIMRQPEPPQPALPLPESMGEIQFSTTGGPFYAEEPASLQVELRLPFAVDPILANSQPRIILLYRFQIIPGSTSVRIELETLDFE